MIKEYQISIDFTEVTPVSLEVLTILAFSTPINAEYANYLQYVLQNARNIVERIGNRLEDVDFGMHSSGCIVPFGEGGHPYCSNFYQKIRLNLPLSN